MRRVSSLALIALLAAVLSACGAAAPATDTGATTTGGSTDTTSVTTDATTTGGTTDATAETTAETTTDATSAATTGATTTGATSAATTDATTTGATSAATTDATTTGATSAATTNATTTGATSAATTDAVTDATTTGTGTEDTQATVLAANPTSATPAAGTATDDILAIAEADGRFGVLLSAIQAADLEETLGAAGPFTLFAPTDEAFAALPEPVLSALLADPETLGQILSYHVVQGTITADRIVSYASLPTVQGQTITVSSSGGNVTLNGDTKVLSTDILASNGVIHVIDKVLVPADVTLPAGS